MRDKFTMRGLFTVWDITRGDEILIARTPNLINTQGRTAIQKAIQNNSPSQLADYVVVSNATTSPQASDTSLPATVLLGLAATKSQPSATVMRWQATFSDTQANGSWSLFGLCNAAAGTGLIASGLLTTAITKSSGFTWIARYEITINW